jgi:hypothetical protein
VSLPTLQTCLKESDGSDTEDFGSDHSEDCLSEASWEPVDKKETEVCMCRQMYSGYFMQASGLYFSEMNYCGLNSSPQISTILLGK